jgi:hypothetical protein
VALSPSANENHPDNWVPALVDNQGIEKLHIMEPEF